MGTDLTFKDLKQEIDRQFIRSGWITVYRSYYDRQNGESDAVYCALVHKTKVPEAMKSHSWNLHIGSGRPGFVFVYRNGLQKASYYRNEKKGCETFIHCRGEFGNQEGYSEISEEFRLYFNLFEEVISPAQSKYFRFDDSGYKELVAVIERDSVRLQYRYLKDYISARKCHFLVFYEGMRFSDRNPKELNLAEIDEDVVTSNHIYNHYIRDISDMHIRNDKTQSWLIGKCLIRPIKGYKPSMRAPMSESEIYENFIIGYDSEGKPKESTSNEEVLSNNFGKNPGAPHYLTPVYFSLQVLNKYYEDPANYEVSDGLVSRKGFWSLRLDNSLPDYVIVFLGDLGKLPHREQLYWKSYNILPQGGMSRAGFKRAILGEFAEPDRPDLFFKMRLASFNKKWKKRYGWNLFMPLSEGDSHYLETLHIPLVSNNVKEFDEQLLAIVKIMIDSLNEKELASHSDSLKEGAKGIDKLESFISSKGQKVVSMIQFLRNVQLLRSTTVVHRRSRNVEKNERLSEYFQLKAKDLKLIFEDILIRMVWTLNTLEYLLIDQQTGDSNDGTS